MAAIRDENEASPTRDAISGFEELAGSVNEEEAADLLTLASATNSAAMSGEVYVGWSAAYEAFYVKYAEACGAELAD